MPKRLLPALALLLVLNLPACVLNLGPAATPTPTPTPTATPIPLAASVNSEGITIPEFDAELARYEQAQAALGATVSPETAARDVLDEMINTLLLAQGAAANGYSADPATVQSRIDALAAQVGGAEALSAWEAAHGYTDADFRSELILEIDAAWMRDLIVGGVPTTAEQVHVKQILLYNSDTALQALGYLKAGWKFEDLAAQYDPVTKGELGWFPQGYLSDPAIEQAVFALQPGQYSDVIQTQAGYHLFFVVERDPARALSPDALVTLQERAVQDWLTQKRSQSTILLAP